jgi:hypothetical protein
MARIKTLLDIIIIIIIILLLDITINIANYRNHTFSADCHYTKFQNYSVVQSEYVRVWAILLNSVYVIKVSVSL